MTRELSMSAMVCLPRLNGESAVALGEQLLTAAARTAPLPVFIERPRTRLVAAVEALKGELVPKEEADTGTAEEADRAVDGAWRSFSLWLGAMAGTPEGSLPNLEEVRKLDDLLFEEGLSFIVLSYREEWAQSESKLKTIAEGGYEKLIDALGGTPFLNNLKSAHNRYGQALGIRSPSEVGESQTLRENLNRLSAALREYLAKAAAYPDPEEPDSLTLSETLLAPFVHWKDTPTRSSAGTGAETPSTA